MNDSHILVPGYQMDIRVSGTKLCSYLQPVCYSVISAACGTVSIIDAVLAALLARTGVASSQILSCPLM